jgi:2,5-diketo-D-gluconate reductase A
MLIEAWSPLASGQLVNDPVIGRIATEHQKSIAQVLIRWHLQLGNVVLPKSITPVRIRENIDVFDFELTPENMETISSLENGKRVGPNPDEFM